MFYIVLMPPFGEPIIRYRDRSFPGWVECTLTDFKGRRHTITDQLPAFAAESLNENCEYPARGAVQCEILERFHDGRGNAVVRITLQRPCAIESLEGVDAFTVAMENLRD
jgi:hypothetical protein